jgi:hypothetical protein
MLIGDQVMSNSLTTIDFHGATLIAVRGETPETTLVAMKPVVEGMGLDWKSQHAKIAGHPILSKGMVEITIPSAGGSQGMTALPLNRLNFWLATVQPKKVPDAAVRAKVIAYQTECADVLFAHFFGKVVGDELSQDNRQVIGGILKAVTNKAMAALRSEIMSDFATLKAEVAAVVEGFDQTQGIVTNYRPMLDVLKEEGVAPKARRSLSQRCSSKIHRWCAATQRDRAIRISRETGRYLFHVEAIRDWLDAEGRTLIRAHKDRIAGQGVLRLIPNRQG